jgi:hypothetical protein
MSGPNDYKARYTHSLPETEYVELYNTTDKAIELNGWSFLYGSKPTVLTALLLEADGYIVLYRSGRDIHIDDSGQDMPLDKFPASLANTGKELALFDPSGKEIDRIAYEKAGEIFLIPFHSIADTLQRMIFYKAAIESNSESALVFEEPEAHSYPPFISKVTQDIIQSDRNQFFITTHSPYVVNDFLELPSDELAIYLVDFRNGETFVKRASDTEIQEMYEYGIDLFFNTETFLR